MATIPDSVKTRLDTDWSIAGGAEPTYYVEEDIRMNPPAGQDYILIQSSTLDTDSRPVNDKFANEAHVLDIIVNTLTSEDRLKEISDEVVRVLNATAITDMTYQRLKRRKIMSGIDKGIFNYQERITYDLRQQMKESAASYGAGAGTNLDDLLMYGSAHAAWVPCVYSDHTNVARKYLVNSTSGMVSNADATNASLRFDLQLPTTKGSLKLYISGSRVSLYDADADAKIDTTTVYGLIKTGVTSINADTTDYNSQDDWDDTFVAVDCSSYNGVMVWLAAVVDAANELDIASVSLRCYYA